MKIIWTKAVILFCCSLSCCTEVFSQSENRGLFESEPKTENIGERFRSNAVALTVNNQQISIRQVEQVFADSLDLIYEKVNAGKIKKENLQEAIKVAWTSALDTIIQDTLTDQLGRAQRQKFIRMIVANSNPSTPTHRMIDVFERWESDAIRQLRRHKIEQGGGEKALREALRRKGMLMEEWERGLQLEVFRHFVLRQSLGNIVLSPRVIKEYYRKHKEEFNTPDAWVLRRIRIPKNRFSKPEAAQQAAQLIRKRLVKGMNFAQLALSLDYDPAYRKTGGTLVKDKKTGHPSGTFPKEEGLAKKYELKNDDLSPVIDDGDAYLIIKLDEYREGKEATFAEVVEIVQSKAYHELLKERKKEFFDKKRKEAYVEINQSTPPAYWLENPFRAK